MNYSTKSYKKCLINIKYFSVFILTIFLFIILLFYQNSYSIGIKNGIYFCVNILIPSLFPFMFLSSYIIKSGISRAIGKILSPITKFLFYLPRYTSTAIILGFIGGYPTGPKCVQQLISQDMINKEQADRLLKFSIGAGPAFIISVVGGCLLKNITIGLIIFISQIFTSIFIGISLGIYARITKKPMYEKETTNKYNNDPIGTIILSCNDAVNSTVNMCSLVILFSSFLAILNSVNIDQFIHYIFPGINMQNISSSVILSTFIEVNSACLSIANIIKSPTLIAFAIGWGGICVHFQIISVISNSHNIKIFNFMIFRLIQGVISAVFVYIITNTVDLQMPVIATIDSTTKRIGSAFLSTSIQGGFALILVCIYFLYNISSNYFDNISNKNQ